jgi:hypothetical protein
MYYNDYNVMRVSVWFVLFFSFFSVKIHDIWEGNVTTRIVKFKLRTYVPHGFQDIRDKVTIGELILRRFRVYVLHHVLYFEDFNTYRTQNCPSKC